MQMLAVKADSNPFQAASQSASGPPSRPRVEAVVEGLQALLVDVGVDLGGRGVGVAEHGLHRSQVGAVLEQMGGEAVAESVRRERAQAGLEAVAAQQLPETLPGHRLAGVV